MAKKQQKKRRKNASKKMERNGSAGGDSRGGRRLAAGIDPAAQAAVLVRMRRARGQAAGIERMIEDDRACADIITQIVAARASLLAVAKALLKEHMQRSHATAAQNGGVAVDDMYQELVDLLTKMAR